MITLPNQKDEIFIFGSCSGTEPMPGRHHCSFAVRHKERLYWFDAGENCSHTAHLMGLDLTAIEAIFITHPHMDHIGGLENLLWTIRKLEGRPEYPSRNGRALRVFMPDENVWPAMMRILAETEGHFECPYPIEEARVSDDFCFEEDGLRVTALHTNHLPPCEDGTWCAYGYRIETGGKVIAFTGDFKMLSELEPLLTGADIVLAETGHRTPLELCRQINEMGLKIPQLWFIHHGRAILERGQAAVDEAAAIYSGEMRILNDGDRFIL